jgi:hypothetical protein
VSRIFCALLLQALLLSASAALAQEPSVNIAGTWESGNSDSADVEITQTGQHITARFTTVSPGTKRLGFSTGEVSFVGEIIGRQVRGRLRLHYPLSVKSLCPQQWEKWEAINLSLSHTVTSYDEFGRPTNEEDVLSGTRPYDEIGPNCVVGPPSSRRIRWVQYAFTDYGISPPLPRPTDQAPQRIWIRADRASALVGTPVNLTVGLAGHSDPSVRATRNYQIALVADHGSVQPSVVKLEMGSGTALAQLIAHEAGDVRVTAPSTNGLAGATSESTFCDQGD